MNPDRRYAQLYDLAVTLTDDVPLYLDVLSDLTHSIVEIGCGTGRVTIPLARDGHRILASDISSHMVDVAKEKLEGEPEAVQKLVRLEVGDMLNIAVPADVDTFLIPYNVLKYNTTLEEQLNFLSGCAQRLSDGGRVLVHCDVDRFDPDQIQFGERLPLFQNRTDPKTGHAVSSFHIVHSIDRSSWLIKAEAQYVESLPSGEEFQCGFTGTMRMLRDPLEIPDLCQHAGFTVVCSWGDFGKSPLTAESPKAIVAGKKMSNKGMKSDA